MATEPREDWRLYGELFVDAEGKAHFICHTKDEDFLSTKTAFQQFIGLLEAQIAEQRNCPYFKAEPHVTRDSLPNDREELHLFCEDAPNRPGHEPTIGERMTQTGK